MSAGGNTGSANIARFAIPGLAIAIGLRSMGLADNIVNIAFGFTIVAVAVGVAFGLVGPTRSPGVLLGHCAQSQCPLTN